MKFEPIKIELQSQWMEIYPYSLCLDDIFFRVRNSNGDLLYELLLTTHLFENIIYDFLKNFRNLNQESFVYKYYDRDYIGANEDWANRTEEIINASEFLEMLISLESKICVVEHIENEYLKKAYNELIEICKYSILGNYHFFVYIDK